jgi:hypothetical protein
MLRRKSQKPGCLESEHVKKCTHNSQLTKPRTSIILVLVPVRIAPISHHFPQAKRFSTAKQQTTDMASDDDAPESMDSDHDERKQGHEASSTVEEEIGRTSTEKARGIEKDDSPEAIVRRENKFITLLRMLVILFLLLAAAATVTFVYLYMSQIQKDRFKTEYAALSSTVISSLYIDLRLNFWMAHTLSKAITTAVTMSDQPVTNFTMPTSLWNGLTEEARFAADQIAVSWIPFLFTDEDRLDFETHARQYAESNAEESSDNPVCHVCGDPGLVVEDESVQVEAAGVTFTCGIAYEGGLDGSVPEELCSSTQELVIELCHCKKATLENISSAPKTKSFSWDVRDGLFRFNDTGRNASRVSQEFGQAPYAPMYGVSYKTKRESQPLYNTLDDPVRARALAMVMFGGKPAMSEMRQREGPYYSYASEFMGLQTTDLYYPVFSDDSESRQVIGAVGLEYLWRDFTKGAVPLNSDLVSVVIENSCQQIHSYRIDPVAKKLEFQGAEDLHDYRYDEMVHSTSFEDYDVLLRGAGPDSSDVDYCQYR